MKYFTINELTKSATADAKGIDNSPTGDVIKNLNKLVDNILDPLREAWGSPLYVNSGYRCKELNKAVGGVSNSLHLTGCAADITTKSKENNRKLFDLFLSLNLSFSECIDESDMSWVHLSYKEDWLINRVSKL